MSNELKTALERQTYYRNTRELTVAACLLQGLGLGSCPTCLTCMPLAPREAGFDTVLPPTDTQSSGGPGGQPENCLLSYPVLNWQY